jgi:hypothetical protein
MTVVPSFLMLGAQLLIPVSDTVPTFDVATSCKGAATVHVADSQTFNSCMKDENTARAQLLKAWQSWSAPDRTQCTAEASTGGPPSYVDLLVCLQMSRDADAIGKIKLKGAGTRH